MRKPSIAMLGGLFMLGACCNPDQCHQAKAGFAALTPVTDGLTAYHSNNGTSPENLQQAFPSGLPDTVTRSGDTGGYEVLLPRRGRQSFSYGSALWGEYGAPDGARGLSFRYYGPGTNHCSWRAERPVWTCTGVD